MNDSRKCTERAAILSEAAATRYDERFDAGVFASATEGKTIGYQHRLINSALALCGDPTYRIAWHWSHDAWAFLALFA